MGALKKWLDKKWVRIGTDGSIKGECGTSKNKKNPDRCLPLKKAQSMSKSKEPLLPKKRKDLVEKESNLFLILKQLK